VSLGALTPFRTATSSTGADDFGSHHGRDVTLFVIYKKFAETISFALWKFCHISLS
jgi:hypothetical protein